ncbi:MAG: hypothetical protein IJ270_07670 [Paludibacteraceae bacterium]|nr:hypothetical protein [Paludibacteraceae bacterium]
MKTKFLFIGLLCLGLLSCEKDKREGDVIGEDKKEIEEKKEVRGFLPGVFSVSDSTKVQFSQGNLQYQASTDTWRFAEHQYDMVGIGYGLTDDEEDCYVGGTVLNSDNREISPKYNGWIDLFGWGTGDNPTKVSTNYEDYSIFEDWGDNEISNGGNVSDAWFTLSYDEWDYLLNDRPNASSKKGVAMVNGVNGLVLLPDDCNLQIGANYNSSEWKKMEEAGAVFLPAAGYRDFGNNGIYVDDCGEIGYYWTYNYDYTEGSYTSEEFWFIESVQEVRKVDKYDIRCGESVRLCKIYEK